MRIGLLIYNPDSGSQKVPDFLDELLAHGMSKGLFLVPVRLGPSPGFTDFLVRLLASPWVEFIIVSGGDGTIGSIARLVLSHRPSLPMGIMPSGTSNDFAESLHLPEDEWECIDVVAKGETAALDVGRVNGEHIFLSTCAAGMFVNISYTISSQLKKSLGLLAYYISALGELPNIRPFPLRIETDGEEVIEDVFLLFLLINGSQAAGLANLYPKASMMDGCMDLLLIRDVPPLDLPGLLLEIINRENIEDGRWFKRMSARRFKFTSPHPLLTTQDGEAGLPLPLDVEVLPRALTVFVDAPLQIENI
ncbi:MAG: YegS/Rv2252/BmrU family lipid kinase [Oscillospiraceae bacterium]|nr:YegS/Rv2252/BmrU family lipid kinase [Oscillospiraceae bacterium]